MKVAAEEFLRLVLAEIDAVDRMARGLTRNAAEADDLVQETYVHALKARQTFELRPFGVRPWLLRIAHNVYVTRAKREARQPKAVTSDELENAAVIGPPEPLEPGLTLSDDRVQAAVDALPADLRTVLILWAVDELEYRAIADVLGIPIGTVMSRLHRARQKIAGLLAGHPAARAGMK